MFTGKPTRKPGSPAVLDGGDNSVDVDNLAAAPGTSLLNSIDDLPYNNPDAAMATLAMRPGVAEGHPQGAIRTRTSSGGGMLQKTAVTTAPKTSSAPRGVNTVQTSPSSIVK